MVPKIILDPKRFLDLEVFATPQSSLISQLIRLRQKRFLNQINLTKKIFEPKNIFDPNDNFDPKMFLTPKKNQFLLFRALMVYFWGQNKVQNCSGAYSYSWTTFIFYSSFNSDFRSWPNFEVVLFYFLGANGLFLGLG